MIYIVTNHHGHDRFVHLQSNYLLRYTQSDYKVYCGLSNMSELENIKYDANSAEVYQFVSTDDIILKNCHGLKMNFLTNTIKDREQIGDDDLIVFLDGDAFPISSWESEVREALKKNKLVSVYRTENLEPLIPEEHKPYPHLLFVAVKAKFWFDNDLKWEKSQGEGPLGPPLKLWLEENGHSVYPLLRSNKVDVHPLFFGVYGDLIYHHGASSGQNKVYDSFDIWSRKGLNDDDEIDIRHCNLDLRYPHIPYFNGKLSELVYEAILSDQDFIKNFFMGVK